MKIVSQEPEITFDDILLLPNKSKFEMDKSISEIDISSRVSKNIVLKTPIVSAPMPGVTESEMAIAIGNLGGMGFIHPFNGFEYQLREVYKVKKAKVKVAASMSDLGKSGIRHIENLLSMGADLISIESYHAYNSDLIDFLKKIKKTFRGVEISVGVLATPEGTRDLIRAGADSIRVGIGGGSHCTTRLVTGVGRPQLSTVRYCSQVAKKYKIPLISDTGIKYSGDVAKALVFGADCVMIGGMFSGTKETPGKIISKGGKRYKYSQGMCTKDASKKKIPLRRKISNRIRNLFMNNQMANNTSVNSIFLEEGVSGLVTYKGSVVEIIQNINSSLKRSMWYQGVQSISEMQNKAKVVLVSKSTQLENIPRI